MYTHYDKISRMHHKLCQKTIRFQKKSFYQKESDHAI